MNRRQPEILAPAGSMETLIAALRTGADAVYAGGKKYSARSNASNFTIEELAEAADMCHLGGAKLYLAVNTIISDDEVEEFCQYIKRTAAAGIDAYIVQDLGAAELIRRCVPDAVLHASTQMTVHTACGAKFLKELGYARVVPARELGKNTLKKICDTGIETEIFVHGALCMSVSGQCYMSALIGSRSANRGCCGQACRLPFSAVEKNGYSALSLKDLSLIPNSKELMQIGADSLKIEGRMKRPEYVAASVNALNKAFKGTEPDMHLLRGIFSRGGFTDGYFIENRIDMFGVREKNDVISAQSLIPKIHELYRYVRKSRVIDFHVVIKSGQPVRITALCDEFSVSAVSDVPESAQKRPTDLAILEKQLSRLGDTVYKFGKISADIDEGLAVPSGKLNEIRRTLTKKMNALIISGLRPSHHITEYLPAPVSEESFQKDIKLPLRVCCCTAEQIRTAYDSAEYIIAPISLLLTGLPENIDNNRIIADPPRFISDENKTFEELKILFNQGITHLMCNTLDCIAIGRQIGFTLHGGFGLNIYNSYSSEYLKKIGISDFTASFEAKIAQLNSMSPAIPMGAVIYGRLPLMLTRNCPIKNEVECRRCTGHITDRTGRKFPVRCCSEYAEILNSDILFMSDKLEQFTSLSFGIILLSNENAEQTRDALKNIRPKGKITRGLYYRGID